MPIKHQAKSFRIKDGVRYESWGDFGDRDDAKEVVLGLRREGNKAFAEHSNEGYSRVFVFFPLKAAIEFAEETAPLPRCIHGSCLRDGSGERLAPPCGCIN